MSARDKANRVLIHVILILVSITMLVPFLWMILTAFKTMTEATSVNPFVILPSTWRWDSFKEVSENMDFLHLYINTLLLILGRVVCAVLTATLAGYAFGRLNFRGKNLMFSLVLFQMMVPSMVALGIFTAVFAYKDLMWPLICNKDVMPLSAALAKMQGQYTNNYPQLMAASLLACIPMIVLYLIFQKQFIEGIATSGGKL